MTASKRNTLNRQATIEMNCKILMLSYETDTIEYVPYDSIYMKL